MSVILIHTYPHRLDENGNPIQKIRFVESTVEPMVRRGDTPIRDLVTRINILKTLKK